MSEGFIPVTKIIEYGNLTEDEDVDLLVEIILACDNKYLTMKHEESKKKAK